ncbi:MAG: ester cyclase [Candidatus Nitrosopolaris sp.]
MAYEQNKAIARRFIQELFNEGKVDEAKNFVTPDIIYHGLEELRGLEDFKKWIIEDRKTFPDLEVTIVEDMAEGNNVAVRWTLKATHEGDFAGLPASHKKFEAHGAEIFHFENSKIKEAWTIFDALAPALRLGVVEMVQPEQSKK